MVQLVVTAIEFYNTDCTDAIDYKTYAETARLDNWWFILFNDGAKLNNKIAKWGYWGGVGLVNETANLDAGPTQLDVEVVILDDATPGTGNKLYVYSLYWFV